MKVITSLNLSKLQNDDVSGFHLFQKLATFQLNSGE